MKTWSASLCLLAAILLFEPSTPACACKAVSMQGYLLEELVADEASADAIDAEQLALGGRLELTGDGEGGILFGTLRDETGATTAKFGEQP